MWKDTLKKKAGEYVCKFHLPELANLRISGFKAKKKLSIDGFSELLTRVIPPVLKGEVECDVDAIINYAQKFFPGLSRETKVDSNKERLPYFIEMAMEDISGWLKSGNREKIEEALGQYSSELERLETRDAKKQVVDGHFGYVEPKMTPAQEAAADLIESNGGTLANIAIKAYYEYLLEYVLEDEDKSVIQNDNGDLVNEEFNRRIETSGINISPRSFKDLAYIEIYFHSAWDEEHQINVILHGERVVDVLDSGGGWVDPQDENRPKVRNPFTGEMM